MESNRRAAIWPLPATVLFLARLDGTDDVEEMIAKSMGSPVSIDVTVARAAPTMLDQKSLVQSSGGEKRYRQSIAGTEQRSDGGNG